MWNINPNIPVLTLGMPGMWWGLCVRVAGDTRHVVKLSPSPFFLGPNHGQWWPLLVGLVWVWSWGWQDACWEPCSGVRGQVLRLLHRLGGEGVTAESVSAPLSGPWPVEVPCQGLSPRKAECVLCERMSGFPSVAWVDMRYLRDCLSEVPFWCWFYLWLFQ